MASTSMVVFIVTYPMVTRGLPPYRQDSVTTQTSSQTSSQCSRNTEARLGGLRKFLFFFEKFGCGGKI